MQSIGEVLSLDLSVRSSNLKVWSLNFQSIQLSIRRSVGIHRPNPFTQFHHTVNDAREYYKASLHVQRLLKLLDDCVKYAGLCGIAAFLARAHR